jgi:hypothetical protein
MLCKKLIRTSQAAASSEGHIIYPSKGIDISSSIITATDGDFKRDLFLRLKLREMISLSQMKQTEYLKKINCYFNTN